MIAAILLFCDYRYHLFSSLRSKIFFITVPVQYAINWPLRLGQKIAANLTSKQIVLNDNLHLRENLLQLQVKLQRLDSLEHENQELRTLLHVAKEARNKVLVAQRLLVELNDLSQEITINKGEEDKVYIGQPVLDAYGLLGQVILVGKKFSKVLLVTNAKSAIPVMVVRNGLQTIAVGQGNNDYLELINNSETADIRVGDLLVTSSLGGRFPAGYQVGVVYEIKRSIGERFVRIVVTPKAHISNNFYMLLLWPGK